MGTRAIFLTCTPLTTAGYYLSVGELEPIMAGRQQVYLRKPVFWSIILPAGRRVIYLTGKLVC